MSAVCWKTAVTTVTTVFVSDTGVVRAVPHRPEPRGTPAPRRPCISTGRNERATCLSLVSSTSPPQHVGSAMKHIRTLQSIVNESYLHGWLILVEEIETEKDLNPASDGRTHASAFQKRAGCQVLPSFTNKTYTVLQTSITK